MVCLTNCITQVRRATSTTGWWMTRETTDLSQDSPRCPVSRRTVIRPRGWGQLGPELPASCHSWTQGQLPSCQCREDKVDNTINMVLLMGHCPTGEIADRVSDYIKVAKWSRYEIWVGFCVWQTFILRLMIPSIWRHDAPILNDKYFPKAAYGSTANMVEEDVETGLFKYPHLQLRNVSYSVRKGRREERILDMINIEARGGELVALLATSSKFWFYRPSTVLYQWEVSVSMNNNFGPKWK